MGALCKGPTLAKDKGYAWVVMVTAFFASSLHTGFCFGVVGNLTIAHQKFFDIDLQQSSLIGTVHTSLIFLFGPIASALVRKIGCRYVQLFAGTCLLLGVGLSSLSKETWHAVLLFGVLAGIGTSSALIATYEILSKHFHRFRYFAFAAAALGNFLGTALWPIGSQYLLDKYGYSKAMGFMAIFQVFQIIAGISFFEPEGHIEITATGSVKKCDSSSERVTKIGELEKESKAPSNNGYSNEAMDEDIEENDKSVETPSEEVAHKEITVIAYSLKGDIIHLLKSPKVWALLFNCMLWNSTNSTFHILINDYILNRTDLSVEEVALGITILGIAKIVGSLLVVVTSSLKYDRLILHFISVMIYSAVTIAISFSNNKEAYYIMIAMWGAAHAISLANLLAVIIEFCGPRLLVLMFGFELLAEGFGSLAGTSLCTYLAIVTKPQYGIVVAGCNGILGSLILLPVILKKDKS